MLTKRIMPLRQVNLKKRSLLMPGRIMILIVKERSNSEFSKKSSIKTMA